MLAPLVAYDPHQPQDHEQLFVHELRGRYLEVVDDHDPLLGVVEWLL